MMSANNIEKIDKALLRPGRIDCSINFKKANIHNSKQIINTYFNSSKKQLREIEKHLDYKFTPAQLFNLCYSSSDFDEFSNLVKKEAGLLL